MPEGVGYTTPPPPQPPASSTAPRRAPAAVARAGGMEKALQNAPPTTAPAPPGDAQTFGGGTLELSAAAKTAGHSQGSTTGPPAFAAGPRQTTSFVLDGTRSTDDGVVTSALVWDSRSQFDSSPEDTSVTARVAIGDVNGDGLTDVDLDLEVTSPTDAATGQRTGKRQYVATGDLDGDGVDDTTMKIRLTAEVEDPDNATTSVRGMITTDVDSDGKTDVRMMFSLQNGGPDSQPTGSLTVVSGDLNQDGRPDLVARTRESHRLQLQASSISATFSWSEPGTGGPDPPPPPPPPGSAEPPPTGLIS